MVAEETEDVPNTDDGEKVAEPEIGKKKPPTDDKATIAAVAAGG